MIALTLQSVRFIAVRGFAARPSIAKCAAYSSSSITLSSAPEHNGRVKFFDRSKAYGFILPDEPEVVGVSAREGVFVHYNSIVHADDGLDDLGPFHPYLVRGERVRFSVEADEDGKGNRAQNVTFEDGSIVPTIRSGYAKGIAKSKKQRLGGLLLDFISDESVQTDEELLGKIREAAVSTQVEITLAEEREKKSLEVSSDSLE